MQGKRTLDFRLDRFADRARETIELRYRNDVTDLHVTRNNPRGWLGDGGYLDANLAFLREKLPWRNGGKLAEAEAKLTELEAQREHAVAEVERLAGLVGELKAFIDAADLSTDVDELNRAGARLPLAQQALAEAKRELDRLPDPGAHRIRLLHTVTALLYLAEKREELQDAVAELEEEIQIWVDNHGQAAAPKAKAKRAELTRTLDVLTAWLGTEPEKVAA